MCEMMLKGSKEALTVLIVTHVTHVERVERLYYMLKQGTNTFLLITFLIFSYFDFQPLQRASTYIALAGMVGKV